MPTEAPTTLSNYVGYRSTYFCYYRVDSLL